MIKYSEDEIELVKSGFNSITQLSDNFIDYMKQKNGIDLTYDDEYYKYVTLSLKLFIEQALKIKGDDFTNEYRENISNSMKHEHRNYVEYLTYCCAYGYFTGLIID
jgi:hypothetical protein